MRPARLTRSVGATAAVAALVLGAALSLTAPALAAQRPRPPSAQAIVKPGSPAIRITSAPAGTTTSTVATVAWTTTGRSVRTSYSLDGAAFAAAASPIALSGLSVGSHTVVVMAVNSSGSAKASASWTVAAPAFVQPSTPVITSVQTSAPATSPSPAPPQPPTSYSLPASAVRVTTSDELVAALAGDQQGIVLADGVYESPTPFRNYGDHRLYAEHLGGAVLKAGLWMGGNWGAGGGVVQGLVFDVSDPARSPDGGILHVWGPGGVNTQVLDTVFRGNRVVAAGLLAYATDGLVARRLVFGGFTGTALRASDNRSVGYGEPTQRIRAVSDIDVDGVSAPVPGSSNGTAEAGLWIGHPVAEGVRRIRVRNVSWSGIEVVNNAWDTTYADLDIDMSGPNAYSGVGIYLEHYSWRNTIERFRLVGVKTGINAEWADPTRGGVAAAHFTTIRAGLVDAAGWTAGGKTIGIYLDEGTEATTVSGVVFRNQSWAAIGAYRNTGVNSFAGNDTTGIAPGAVAESTQHP